FFSSRRRHTRWPRDWSSDVCSSDLFSHTPAGQDGEGDCTLGDVLPSSAVHEPPLVVISTEELQSLVFSLGTGLSPLEADALRLRSEERRVGKEGRSRWCAE